MDKNEYGDLGDYVLDDDIFKDSAGINKITEGYAKVFECLSKTADEGATLAKSGSAKEIAACINKLSSKVAALIELTQLDKKIVGPNGKIFNVFGQELDEDMPEDENEILDESEIVERVNAIVSGVSDISLNDAVTAADEANITDDGMSHGDLDDMNW